MRHSKKLTAGLAVITASLLGTGIAFAAWSSNGSGSGTAQSTTDDPSTISASVSGYVPDLYPGAIKSITVDIDNPNDYPVVVTSISAGASAALADVGNGVCAVATVSSDVVALNAAGIDQDGPAGVQIAGNGSGTYRLTTRMLGSATDGCKSRTFNLALTATLRSDAA